MSDRSWLLASTLAIALLVPAAAGAQAPPRVARVALLTAVTMPPAARQTWVEMFRRHGWEEGRNLTQALMRASRTIPIVMVGNGDPVRYGLVRNLARPEGNVTGVSHLVNERCWRTSGSRRRS